MSMLQVILLILKIIGIILAVILGLLILIILAVMLVPIRYVIRADYHEKPYAEVRVTWLLHLLRLRLSYDGELKIKVKALFFNIFSNEDDKAGADERKAAREHERPEKTKPRQKADKKTGKSQEKNIFDDLEQRELEAEKSQAEKVDSKEQVIEKQKELNGELVLKPESTRLENDKSKSFNSENDESKNDKLENATIENAKSANAGHGDKAADNREAILQEHEDRLEKESTFTKVVNAILGIIKKIIDILRGMCDTIKGIVNKSKETKEKAMAKYNEIRDMLTDPENQEMARFLFAQLKALLKRIKPKKYSVNIRYGFEDAEITGWVAVRAAVIYGFLGMDVNIIPDFDNSIFEGDVYMKGRVTLLSIGIIALKVYRNKRFRQLVLER